MRRIRRAVLIFLLACAASAHVLQAQGDSTEVTGLDRTYSLAGRGELWSDAQGLTPTGREALETLRQAEAQGLRAEYYDVARLDGLVARVDSARADSAARAMLDRDLTAALLDFLNDVHAGRTRPPALSRSIAAMPWDAAADLARVADGIAVADVVRAAEPPFRQYRLLVQALAQYRERAAANPGLAALAGDVTRLELAMERLRWIPVRDTGAIIIVNVPAFRLRALDSLRAPVPALTMRVIVGQADQTPTPIVVELLTAVEFHPYWNVPRSIVTGEILPILRRRSTYLGSEDMEVVTPAGEVLGDQVSADILAGLADGSLLLRQRPGARNALGSVKFIFPNAQSIYLHDTPARALFEETRRDFSHGCIRLEHAPSLAEWVLSREAGWDAARVDAALRDSTTRRVTLAAPIPVAVVYTTAIVNQDGEATFFPDVYGLDDVLGRAMRAGRAQ